jgi:trehalose 6-phosphate phosphatase
LATTAGRFSAAPGCARQASHAAANGIIDSQMKHLSSPAGQDALRNLSLTRALFAFDFDGTLAPIVTQPDAARLAIGVEQRLAQLAQCALVAVISGRSLADLRARIPAEVRHLVGNHGSEGTAEAIDTDAMRRVCSAWIAQLKNELAGSGSDAGIILEDKGFTLSVHYRLAADPALAAQQLSALVLRLEPVPRVIGGKLVLNLLPPNARTKFEALVDLAQREAVEGVLFVGDDETDELAFAQAPAHWTTVRVEPDRTRQARFFIDRQSDVSALLDQLLKLCAGQSTSLNR